MATSERRRRSCSTSTPPTTRSTASKKVGSSMATTTAIYLPLYIFCGRFLLGAKLRPANIDGAAGAVDEVARIVARIRARWPKVRIVLRGDSGFCRELMAWCEAEGVAYLFGLAPNARLGGAGARGLSAVVPNHRQGGSAVQGFRLPDRDLLEPTAAGCGQGRAPARRCQSAFRGDQPGQRRPRPLRRSLLRPRRDGKPHQGMPARSPTARPATMQANQLRLWFASMAYVLLSELRRIALRHTQFAMPPAAPSG